MKKYFLLVFFCALTTIGANAVVWPGNTGNDPIEGLRIYDDGNGTQYIEVTEPDALFNLYASYKDDDGLIGLGQDECKKLKLIGNFSDFDLATLFVNESTGFWSNFTDLDASEMNYVGDEEDGSELLFLQGWTGLQKLTFPKSIVAIPSGLFGHTSNTYSLTEIIIPDLDNSNVTIGSQAFMNLTSLESVTIGRGVANIGSESGEVFRNCTSLTTVDMRGGIVLGPRVFMDCTSLDTVILPEGLTTIGSDAFANATFSSIRLPNSLRTIGANAFMNCDNITEIVIPAGVERVGNLAFNSCQRLSDVYVLGSNTICEQGGFDNKDINKFEYNDNLDGVTDRRDWLSDNTATYGNDKHPVVLHLPEDVYDEVAHPLLAYATRYYEAQTNEEKQAVITDMSNDGYSGYTWMVQYRFDYEFKIDEEGRVYFKREGSSFGQPFVDPSDNKAGWKEFMLTAKMKREEEWPDTRMVDDKWYSMCFPFPMTGVQLGNAFGAAVEVCEFSGVDIQEKGNKKLITLKFKRPVTETVAHRAYMIHPGFHNAESGTGTITNTIVGVKLANDFNKAIVEKDAAELTTDEQTVIGGLRTALTAQQTDITEGGVTYTFKGSYFKNEKLPKFTYYWWPGGDGWEASFYKTMTDGAVSWSPYTSVVLCDKDNHASNAKMVYYIETEDDLFEINEEQLGIATAITKPSTTKDSATVFEGKVMNMSGQVVADSTDGINGLPKGIYVVNGRKYVVR